MYNKPNAVINELSVMTEHLSDYLLGDRLFKTISVPSTKGERLVKMTLGGMIERIAQLEEGAPPGAAEVIHEAKQALQQKQHSYAHYFFEKLAQEVKSYTDSWNWFLQNCWENESRCYSDYAAEVNIRLRLERLLACAGEHQQVADSRRRIRTLDGRLRGIWQEADKPIIGKEGDYPRAQYWWLYGHPGP